MVLSMKKLLWALLLCLCLTGCAVPDQTDIAATTLPVWQFTCRITEGTHTGQQDLIRRAELFVCQGSPRGELRLSKNLQK